MGYLGYYEGEIDGAWGEMSQAATRAFQRDYGRTADGIFGVGTEARIREVVASGETPRHTQDVPKAGGADWWKDIRYFKRAEFRCPCGRCGGFPVEPQESIARTVDEIRHRLGIPISIVDGGGSGVRCAAHNAEVGGVANSQHLYGLAADMRAGRFETVEALKKTGKTEKAERLTAMYRKHIDNIIKIGTSYPEHEVRYEQTIVTPAVMLIAQMYQITHDKALIEECRKQLMILEKFNGRQPTHYMNDLAVRH